MRALVIPDDGSPVVEVDLPEEGGLAVLQGLVGGGSIEAVPLPDFIAGADRATAYVNEDGKAREDLAPNMRATDFLVPGVGMFFGDYVAGPMVVAGFDLATGGHAELPDTVEARVRLVEREAGSVA